VATTATLDSLIAGSDVILDMRKDKTYRETMNKFFNDYVNKEYNDIAETGKAILLELQRSLGTEGRFRKGAGNRDAVESETALQSKLSFILLCEDESYTCILSHGNAFILSSNSDTSKPCKEVAKPNTRQQRVCIASKSEQNSRQFRCTIRADTIQR